MSEALDAEFLALKGKVDELRKKDRLPYWRLAYAEFSLSPAHDFVIEPVPEVASNAKDSNTPALETEGSAVRAESSASESERYAVLPCL